jgi:hypothetical protein
VEKVYNALRVREQSSLRTNGRETREALGQNYLLQAKNGFAAAHNKLRQRSLFLSFGLPFSTKRADKFTAD